MDDTSVSCSTPALWRISKTFLKESEKLLSLVWAWVKGLNECVFSGSRLTMNDRVSVWMSVVYFGRWWREGGWIFCRHGDRRGWHLKFISYTSSAAVDSLEAQVSMCLCALGWICLNLNVLHAMVSSRLFSKSKQSQRVRDYRLDLVRDFMWTSGGR